MSNLVGEDANDWRRLAAEPGVCLHLYGKSEARPGRKMGHYNCLSDKLDQAIQIAEQVRAELRA